VIATPESDLTESGDSFKTNAYTDVNGGGGTLAPSIALYANGHDLRDPYLSPNFADFSKGFPPTILTCGTRDIFLSNTVLMHRALLRAGIQAELHVWEAMPHGGFFGTPEDQEVLAQQAQFIRKQLGMRGHRREGGSL
jgi:epsilon-lactone hydrolase